MNYIIKAQVLDNTLTVLKVFIELIFAQPLAHNKNSLPA